MCEFTFFWPASKKKSLSPASWAFKKAEFEHVLEKKLDKKL